MASLTGKLLHRKTPWGKDQLGSVSRKAGLWSSRPLQNVEHACVVIVPILEAFYASGLCSRRQFFTAYLADLAPAKPQAAGVPWQSVRAYHCLSEPVVFSSG